MAELVTLLHQEIPEGRNNLSDSHTNLERVADYCEANYFQADNKRIALEETKNYTTQSLASVAYQINTLAYNFLQLLELQSTQLSEMESQMNHISQTVMIHKEKVARREIGVLTANKITSRQYKIIAPANPEKPIKYIRKSIDYTVFDDIGHGVRTVGTPRTKQRGGSQSSVQSLGASSVASGIIANLVGPAPTTKPPTPPQVARTGTLSKGSKEYRTPPAVAPPQVPSHYAPNYPLGHPRRDRGPGYSTLPVHVHNTQHLNHLNSSNAYNTSTPQIGTVHPIQSHGTSSIRSVDSNFNGINHYTDHNINMPLIAIYDYYADKEDELSFQESSVIYVLKKNDDGWWEGVMDGITGLFPGNYVEHCV
ncbi:abl interactor 2 isoform X2 [Phymastichus coffea]|uniref:abl interactor 2 isoform X2 n=1 Tax=Phymastichus coffea TaxID=108790 RepID=UPI00273C304A|nr:abl interactor 2 isoform X2 [Phymastichus coffea]